MKNYTNEDVVKMYYNIASRYSEVFKIGKILSACQNIKDSKINLYDFYLSNDGNFDELKIEGVDKKAKAYLKLIFENGYEGAIEKIEKERMEKAGAKTLESLESAVASA